MRIYYISIQILYNIYHTYVVRYVIYKVQMQLDRKMKGKERFHTKVIHLQYMHFLERVRRHKVFHQPDPSKHFE